MQEIRITISDLPEEDKIALSKLVFITIEQPKLIRNIRV